MNITNKADSVARYAALKTTITKVAAKHPGYVEQKGDRFEVTKDFRAPVGEQKLVFSAGSAFDNDIATPDKITVAQQDGGSEQKEVYENYSEKKGWLIKRDQEFLKVSLSQSSVGGFSNSSTTFEI